MPGFVLGIGYIVINKTWFLPSRSRQSRGVKKTIKQSSTLICHQCYKRNTWVPKDRMLSLHRGKEEGTSDLGDVNLSYWGAGTQAERAKYWVCRVAPGGTVGGSADLEGWGMGEC